MVLNSKIEFTDITGDAWVDANGRWVERPGVCTECGINRTHRWDILFQRYVCDDWTASSCADYLFREYMKW